MSIGTLLSVGAITTTVQANAVDFTCPAKTVCFYPTQTYTGGYNPPPWNGQPAQFGTAKYNGAWHTFTSEAVTPNPQSMNVNGSSCVWVHTNQFGGTSVPIPPNTKDVILGQYGSFYIQLGVDPCPINPPPGAP